MAEPTHCARNRPLSLLFPTSKTHACPDQRHSQSQFADATVSGTGEEGPRKTWELQRSRERHEIHFVNVGATQDEDDNQKGELHSRMIRMWWRARRQTQTRNASM